MTIKPIHIILLTLLLFIISSCGAKYKSLLYLDPNKPGIERQVFAPEVISKKERAEFGSVFNKKGDVFYFAVDTAKRAEIWYTKITKGKWMEPILIFADEKYSFNDPYLSPDEQRLYFISDLPRNEADTINDIDIWYAQRQANDTWSAPINAGDQINSDHNEYYMTFTATGKMYFSSNKENAPKRKHDFEIYSAELVNGVYQEPVKLGDAINSKRYEADMYIAPDESYIIFCSARKSGYGRGDLYISFKDEAGAWTPAKNMGTAINTEHHELCPFVTHDGQYLFYTSNQDIYWVSMRLVEELK